MHKQIALKKDMLYYCYESGDKFTTKWENAICSFSEQKQLAREYENVVDKLWNDMERINAALYSNVSFGVAVDSIYQDYYTDHIISSEECSQMLAERLYIAINE